MVMIRVDPSSQLSLFSSRQPLLCMSFAGPVFQSLLPSLFAIWSFSIWYQWSPSLLSYFLGEGAEKKEWKSGLLPNREGGGGDVSKDKKLKTLYIGVLNLLKIAQNGLL